jgi:uncharacterized protein (UPF0303 family)
MLKALRQQERSLQFSRFDNEMALALGLRLVAAAARDGQAVTANISRNGQVLFHHAMVGTCINHAEWIRRKNNVVNRFGHSSWYVGIEARQRGHDFDRNPTLDIKDFAASGGAFPLTIREVGQVGTITVAGLSEAQDHGLVVGAVAEFLDLPVEHVVG